MKERHLYSIYKVKEFAMNHCEACCKRNHCYITLSVSNLPGPSFLPDTLTFVPLTLIIPLSLCEISFHACTDDHNGFLSELQTSDWPQLLHEPEASNHPIYAR